MTDYPDPESYYYALHVWLSENGVVFQSPLSEPPFACTIDLNRMKIGMEILIQACGGDSEKLVEDDEPVSVVDWVTDHLDNSGNEIR